MNGSWYNFTKYTYDNQTDLLYIVNVFKIQFEINRKMTADVWDMIVIIDVLQLDCDCFTVL